MRTMPAGEFKAKCLAVMDEVQATGQTVIVTKRGKPVARLAPMEDLPPAESPEAIFGCLRDMATITGDIVSSEFTDEEWEQMFNNKWNRFEQGQPE
jgi:prevent-host-death family protein